MRVRIVLDRERDPESGARCVNRTLLDKGVAVGVEQVVGDLDDLIPAEVPAGAEPDEVTDSVLLDVALDAAREMVLRCGESIAQAQRPSLRQRIRNLGERHVAVRRLLAGYRSVRRPY